MNVLQLADSLPVSEKSPTLNRRDRTYFDLGVDNFPFHRYLVIIKILTQDEYSSYYTRYHQPRQMSSIIT